MTLSCCTSSVDYTARMDETTAPAPADVARELRALFAVDPSEALYRAEAELPFRGPDSFIEFITWATEEH